MDQDGLSEEISATDFIQQRRRGVGHGTRQGKNVKHRPTLRETLGQSSPFLSLTMITTLSKVNLTSRVSENGLTQFLLTVPVEAAYQVWRVTRVLSMGKVGIHVQGVPEKSCKIKPWEIFEKMQF